MENALNLDTVKLAENKKEIVILDQTLLPNQCKYLNISTAGDIWEAIYHLLGLTQGNPGYRLIQMN